MTRPRRFSFHAALTLALIATAALPASGTHLWQATVEGDCSAAADAGSAGAPLAMPGSFTCVGSLTRPTDEWDAFAFPAEAGQVLTLTVSVDVAFADYELRVFRPDGSEPLFLTHGAFFHADPQTFGPWDHLLEASGTWRIAIRALENGRTPYDLRVDLHAPPVHDDCGAGRDATSSAPVAFPASGSCSGSFPSRSGDHQDAFTFDAADGAEVRFEVQPVGGSRPTLCVDGPAATDEECVFHAPWTIGGRASAAGTWILSVGDGAGDYVVAARVVEASVRPPAEDCGALGDAPEWGAEDPRSLPGTIRCLGDFRAFANDHVDLYAVELQAGDMLEGFLEELEGEAALCFLRPAGEVPFLFDICDGQDDPRTAVATTPGEWLVFVEKLRPSARYALNLERTRTLPS
jgi:hypothetical protein